MVSFQGTCTLLNELLTLPTSPKVIGNPKDPSHVTYTPYTPNTVKCQVLITLTTILITNEAHSRQPATLESLVDILFELISSVNDSHDRLLRQTAAEALRELSHHFSGIFASRLGLLLHLAKTEYMHPKQSYISLLSTAVTTTLQCISRIGKNCVEKSPQLFPQHQQPSASSHSNQNQNYSNFNQNLQLTSNQSNTGDTAFAIFEQTLKQLGLETLHSSTKPQIRLFGHSQRPSSDTNQQDHQMELAGKFQLPQFDCSKSSLVNLNVPFPIHWIHYLRSDLEMIATFLLEQVRFLTWIESLRILFHVVYLCQSAFVSKEMVDDINEGILAPLSNHQSPNGRSIIVSTELLVRHDLISNVLKWALNSNIPILWSSVLTVLSRIPVEVLQPTLPRSFAPESVLSNLPLSTHLRDCLFMLSKPHFNHINEHLRYILMESLVRRPVHSDGDEVAFLLTTPPTISLQHSSTMILHQSQKHKRQQGRIINEFPMKSLAGAQMLAPKLFVRKALLLPTPFDSLSLAELKLHLLPYCFVKSHSNPKGAPKTLNLVLCIWNEFVLPGNLSVTRALFRVLTHFLLKFPSLLDFNMEYIENIISEYPHFAHQTWKMLAQVYSTNPSIGIRAFLHLSKWISFKLNPPTRIFNYIRLVINMMHVPGISPKSFLEAILLGLRCIDQKPYTTHLSSGIVSDGLSQLSYSPQTMSTNASIDWKFGDSILAIIHTIIMNHDIRNVLSPLYNLLQWIEIHFGDVEIRDRANFYLKLITHVPSDRIGDIIAVNIKSAAENLDVDNPFVNVEASKQPTSGNSMKVLSKKSNQNSSQSSSQPIKFGIQSSSLLSLSIESNESDTNRASLNPNLLHLEKTSALFNLNSLHALAKSRQSAPAQMSSAYSSIIQDEKTKKQQVDLELICQYYDKVQELQCTEAFQSHENHSSFSSLPSSDIKSTSSSSPNSFSTSKAHSDSNLESCSTIEVPFLLRYKSPIEMQQNFDEIQSKRLSESSHSNETKGNDLDPGHISFDLSHLPTSLYSITLNMRSGALYHQYVNTMHVPYLTSPFHQASHFGKRDHSSNKSSPSSSLLHQHGPRYGITSNLLENEGGSCFPISYSFVLKIKVLLPIPTQLSVFALANTAQGSVAEIALDPITLDLRHLFLPFPRQTCTSSNESDFELFRSKLFKELWQFLTNHKDHYDDLNHENTVSEPHHEDEEAMEEETETEETNPSRFIRRKRSLVLLSQLSPSTSVRFLPFKASFVKERLAMNLSPFFLPEISSPNLQHIFIFLPCRFHLLFKFEIGPDSTVVRIATDWWRVLSHIDAYFDEIFKL